MIATGLIQNLREDLEELLSELTVYKDADSIIKISFQPSIFILWVLTFSKEKGKWTYKVICLSRKILRKYSSVEYYEYLYRTT